VLSLVISIELLGYFVVTHIPTLSSIYNLYLSYEINQFLSRVSISLQPHWSFGHKNHLGQNILYPHKLKCKISYSSKFWTTLDL